jgi:hypothetical protein
MVSSHEVSGPTRSQVSHRQLVDWEERCNFHFDCQEFFRLVDRHPKIVSSMQTVCLALPRLHVITPERHPNFPRYHVWRVQTEIDIRQQLGVHGVPTGSWDRTVERPTPRCFYPLLIMFGSSVGNLCLQSRRTGRQWTIGYVAAAGRPEDAKRRRASVAVGFGRGSSLKHFWIYRVYILHFEIKNWCQMAFVNVTFPFIWQANPTNCKRTVLFKGKKIFLQRRKSVLLLKWSTKLGRDRSPSILSKIIVDVSRAIGGFREPKAMPQDTNTLDKIVPILLTGYI